ncbi:spore coat protein CotJB [Anaeromicropila populeti]|uniref:Spore coat protein JB n=1 Tax=Anaeromicropila populeti TaxID=37658 RepID=A0A1I6J285_9FIRM|nr:spore coat protein CotJB [Anaeromicropila populeti]SFR73076.1 spore coat protein JB [Anaeromicropila populeti]
MTMNQLGRKRLFKFICEVDFALDDICLYLDTHPCDRQALEYYHKYKELREQALAEYSECFGPLTSNQVEDHNYWTWVRDPWPWEGEC